MAGTRRLRVGLGASLREFLRQPVNLALLVALPPVVVVSYGAVLSAFPDLPWLGTDPGTLGALNGALFVAAFLPGVVGLFQVISATADERLALCGFPRAALFGSRLLTVGAASLLTAGLSLAVLTTRTTVADPPVAYLALVTAGLVYGGVGMLVGALLPRELEGSLVLVFLADVDEALASGIVRADTVLADLLPLHYPHALFQPAVEGTGIAAGDALGAAGYLAALLAVALGAYVVVTGEGGVLP